MILGHVVDDEGWIRLTLQGPRGRLKGVAAVIDTGYTSALSLPPSIIQRLGLPWHGAERSILADGEDRMFDVFVGEVVWDGELREVKVDEADTDPLVGMALLRGFELKMQVRQRGKITIEKLPRKRR